MIDYKKRFVEVDEIIKNMPKEDFDKIPNDLISIIRKNKDSNYVWKYDKRKKIADQNLSKDTIAILAYINTEFILENEQRMLMRNIHYFNEMKNEGLKKKKFNLENIFKSYKKKDTHSIIHLLFLYKQNK